MKPRIFVGALLLFAVLAACGDDSTTPNPTIADATDTVVPIDSVVDVTQAEPTDTTLEMTTALITVTVGVDSGPDRIENVPLGQDVELRITNPDEDDEFHLHGFDLGGDETPAGEDEVFSFTANEPGDFEVESHATGEVLVVIRVS